MSGNTFNKIGGQMFYDYEDIRKMLEPQKEDPVYPRFEAMNYIRHLNGFFARLAEDKRMSFYHISLYFATFQQWKV
jgi:hypothetical protein